MNKYNFSSRQPDKTKQTVYEMFKMGNINTIVLTCDPFREYETVDIDQIIQYDVPSHHSTFVHRCGEFGNMNSGTVHVFVETCRPNFYCGEKKTFTEYLKESKKLALVPKWLKARKSNNGNLTFHLIVFQLLLETAYHTMSQEVDHRKNV